MPGTQWLTTILTDTHTFSIILLNDYAKPLQWLSPPPSVGRSGGRSREWASEKVSGQPKAMQIHMSQNQNLNQVWSPSCRPLGHMASLQCVAAWLTLTALWGGLWALVQAWKVAFFPALLATTSTTREVTRLWMANWTQSSEVVTE